MSEMNRRVRGALVVFGALAVAWTLVLLLCAAIVEVGRRTHRGHLPVELAGLVDHPAYKGREGLARALARDVFRSVRTTARYDAFSGWHYGRFDSPTWKTDEHGYRQVPGAPAHPRGRVYMFGGSTLAGWGVLPPDSILARVQKRLPDYEVVSGAHGAYTSRQGVNGLTRIVADRGDLRGDVVVFYDGYNDFWVGCAVGDPSRVTLFEGLLERLYREGRRRRHESLLAAPGRALYRPLLAAANTLIGHHEVQIPRGSVCESSPERRARIAAQLIANWRIAKGITEEFGGRFVGFFHPNLLLSKNRGAYLPARVRAFVQRRDRAFARAQSEAAAAIRSLRQPWARDLSTLYDADPDAPVFLDGTHVTPRGAELAAEAIVAEIRPLLGSSAVAAPATAATPAVTDPTPAAEQGFAGCGATAVNELGVGKPCSKAAQCRGQRAVTCLAASEPGGFPFCTTYCFGLHKDECGPRARCIRRAGKPGVCAPLGCAARLEKPPVPEIPIDLRCQVGKVNGLGVGQPCRTHADCEAFSAAKVCAVVFKEANPSFCSMLCDRDEDCGDHAFCWAKTTVEHGVELTISSCVPNACRM